QHLFSWLLPKLPTHLAPFPIFLYHYLPGLHRNRAVFLRRPAFALSLEIFQAWGNMLARVGRLNDVIDEAAARRDVGRGESGAIRLNQLGPTGGLVLGLLHLLAEDHLDRPFRPHDSDLGGRPGEDTVAAKVPGAHGQVRAA